MTIGHCPVCGGDGWLPSLPEGESTCPGCDGTGKPGPAASLSRAERRYALVYGARTESEVAAYLPQNYRVEGSVIERDDQFSCTRPDGLERTERLAVVISGKDHAGWGFETYVSPRLASGLMAATEIDLSHPAMKAIPV